MGIYRLISSSLETAIDIISSELDKIVNSNSPVVMLGNIKVDSESEEKINQDKMLQSHGIHILNLPPTRLTSHSQISIIQCTNTNEDELSYAVIQTGLSDHTAQSYTVAIDKPNYKLTKQSKTQEFSVRKPYLQPYRYLQV